MALNDLLASKPSVADSVSDGAKEIRYLKNQIVNDLFGPGKRIQQYPTPQWPNIGDNPWNYFPIGTMMCWINTTYQQQLAIPENWAICDGRTVSRTDGNGTITTPDLQFLLMVTFDNVLYIMKH